MQTTTISKLKASLSAYLRQVKAGEEVIIPSMAALWRVYSLRV